jgi:multimeric flavodoxin WrbA
MTKAPEGLLIVFHSQSGNTELLACAVEEGALSVEPVNVRRLSATRVNAEDLRMCRALVICSPEYFGYMAGAVKDLFDRTYEELKEIAVGKPYAVVISAGNDGTGALSSIERIVRGYRFRKVQESIICRGEVVSSSLVLCRELGKTLAAGLDLGIY